MHGQSCLHSSLVIYNAAEAWDDCGSDWIYTTQSLLHCPGFELCRSCGLLKKLKQPAKFTDLSYELVM